MKLAIVVLLAFVTGCSTYKGKVVSRRDAAHMAELGMRVQCPDDVCDTGKKPQ